MCDEPTHADLEARLTEAQAHNETGWETAKMLERANTTLQQRVEALEKALEEILPNCSRAGFMFDICRRAEATLRGVEKK